MVPLPRVDLAAWFRRCQAVPLGTRAIDLVVARLVPLNGVLRPRLLHVAEDEVRVGLALRPVLRNHLGSMHAAALVAVGEYAQALLVYAGAGTTGVDTILATLDVEYLAKARGDVVAAARMDPGTRAGLRDALASGRNETLGLSSVVSDAVTGRELAVLRGGWRARAAR